MVKIGITWGQTQILLAIEKWKHENTWDPSRCDLGHLIGKSNVCVGVYIKKLQAKEMVECGRLNGIRLTCKAKHFLKEIKKEIEQRG